MKRLLLAIFILPVVCFGQKAQNASAFELFNDSLSATLNCGGSGFAHDTNLKNRYSKYAEHTMPKKNTIA